MLNAVPKRWFSWDFVVNDISGQTLGEVRLDNRERGIATAAGTERKIYRQGALKGPFVLEEAGAIVAKAEKPSAFKNAFTIEYGAKLYTLKPRSATGRAMVLLEGDREVGSIAPEKMLVRRSKLELPQELPLHVQQFMLWLTMMIWKRSQDKAADASS